MKEEFVKYLKKIGITEPIRERVEEIYGFYEVLCPDEIIDIFVDDYIKEDGIRKYENLNFFSPKYVMQAKLFINKDNFDIAITQNRIVHIRIEKQFYNFEIAGEKSRINVTVTIDNEFYNEFKASKENCDYLRDIVLKHLKPNLKGYTEE